VIQHFHAKTLYGWETPDMEANRSLAPLGVAQMGISTTLLITISACPKLTSRASTPSRSGNETGRKRRVEIVKRHP
jgi:hypothetical protein